MKSNLLLQKKEKMKTIAWIIKYFRYVLRHKYYVWKKCFEFWLFRQWIVHDLSKFSYYELVGYVRYWWLWLRDKKTQNIYDKWWLSHQNKNKHHRQYWCLINDSDWKLKPIEMPKEYVEEMVCDWRWVGRYYNSDKDEEYKNDDFREVKNFYNKNKENIVLENTSRKYLEYIIWLTKENPYSEHPLMVL